MTHSVPPAREQTDEVATEATATIAEQDAHTPERDTSTAGDDLEALRTILFLREQERLDALDAALSEIEQRTGNDDALLDSITPLLGDMIREKIRTNRDEMVEALYPIIGQLVMRAVSEAIRDLARNVDTQMRSALSFQRLWYHVRARTIGVSAGEAVLRSALSFRIIDIFLIHHDTGLVLWDNAMAGDAASGDAASDDADVVAGMLTAIRDFAADTMGRDHHGHLDEIRYGDREILIETASDAYVAVVYEGFEPPGFREHVRSGLIDLSNRHRQALRNFSGDVAPFAPAGEALAASLALFETGRVEEQRIAKQRQPMQRSMRPATIGGVVFLFLAAIVLLYLLWRWLVP